MAPPKITLYMDVVSPFAYIAYHVIRNDPVFARVEFNVVPISLGGLMKTCGNTPPLKIKNKDKWINKQRTHWASLFSVPMADAPPPGFPANTMAVMRHLVLLPSQSALLKALDALLPASFTHHKAVHDPSVFGPLLTSTLADDKDVDVARLSELAPTEGKKLLLETTSQAFDSGAFGLPWMVCERGEDGKREGFWGVDHLGQVCEFLGLERPGTGRWKSVL